MQIIVEELLGIPVAEHRIEVVERKGVGHPDFMCDAMMEAVSVALSRTYMEQYGRVLHHNIDKGLLAAGQVVKHFGGGEIIKPMELIIGDRATSEVSGKKIPVTEIAVEAAHDWLRNNLRFVDPLKHMTYRVVLEPGSQELTGLFSRASSVLGANDTSATVGYWPLTPTEDFVLKLEAFLNTSKFKEEFPETGEDIKVMGVRQDETLNLTVAMPLIAHDIASEKDYFDRKEAIMKRMCQFVSETSPFPNTAVHFNTLDEPGKGLDGIYLSLLGTSAEDADSGQVGRGNRVNGLIPVSRPIGTEAAAGKNPTSHVGKIYNILAHKMARDIYENVKGLREVYVFLVSRIGAPIDRPQLAAVQLRPVPGSQTELLSQQIKEIFERDLTDIGTFCASLARGEYPVC